jgi:hypothetical protein
MITIDDVQMTEELAKQMSLAQANKRSVRGRSDNAKDENMTHPPPPVMTSNITSTVVRTATVTNIIATSAPLAALLATTGGEAGTSVPLKPVVIPRAPLHSARHHHMMQHQNAPVAGAAAVHHMMNHSQSSCSSSSFSSSAPSATSSSSHSNPTADSCDESIDGPPRMMNAERKSLGCVSFSQILDSSSTPIPPTTTAAAAMITSGNAPIGRATLQQSANSAFSSLSSFSVPLPLHIARRSSSSSSPSSSSAATAHTRFSTPREQLDQQKEEQMDCLMESEKRHHFYQPDDYYLGYRRVIIDWLVYNTPLHRSSPPSSHDIIGINCA